MSQSVSFTRYLDCGRVLGFKRGGLGLSYFKGALQRIFFLEWRSDRIAI